MKNNKRENLIRQIAIQEHKKAKAKKDLLAPITKEKYDTLLANNTIGGTYISEVDLDILNTYAYNKDYTSNKYTKLNAYIDIARKYMNAYSTLEEEYFEEDEE